jgi:hypothetical protein
MIRGIPSQKTVTVQSRPYVQQQIDKIYDIDLEDESNLEHPETYCPECFDKMIRFFDSDKVRYECENCDLVVPEVGVQNFSE